MCIRVSRFTVCSLSSLAKARIQAQPEDASVANGLAQALTEAHAASVGHLMFVGTWHSHPMGGNHSGIAKDTLRKIATDGRGLPAVSLVWTPQGLICAVDRW